MGVAFCETLKETMAIAVAAPTTINSGGTASINTGNGINMANLRRARAILNVGAAAGTLTFKLQASATAGGSYSDITNNTTNPTITGITTANQPNALEIRADQMPTGLPFLRAIATETGAGNVLASIVLIGEDSAYSPGNQFNVATFTNDVVVA